MYWVGIDQKAKGRVAVERLALVYVTNVSADLLIGGVGQLVRGRGLRVTIATVSRHTFRNCANRASILLLNPRLKRQFRDLGRRCRSGNVHVSEVSPRHFKTVSTGTMLRRTFPSLSKRVNSGWGGLGVKRYVVTGFACMMRSGRKVRTEPTKVLTGRTGTLRKIGIAVTKGKGATSTAELVTVVTVNVGGNVRIRMAIRNRGRRTTTTGVRRFFGTGLWRGIVRVLVWFLIGGEYFGESVVEVDPPRRESIEASFYFC